MTLRSMTGLILAMTMGAASVRGADEPTETQVRTAVGRVLPLIEASTKEYRRHRDCFSCHHQAVPVLALTLARQRGFAIDAEGLGESLELTWADLDAAIESYRAGRGQPGGVTRAGYALWALEAGGHVPDETTAAVAGFLLTRDQDRDHWRETSRRPPSEASDFTSTFVALRGLKAFGPEEQHGRIADRVVRARGWLEETQGVDTEERVFRLRALKLASADDAVLRSAADRLRATQLAGGGWSQLDGGESDAYATGSALVALHQDAGMPTDDPVYRRGLAFLIGAQGPDGSWHVRSRSKAFQPYFESGFPHGKDQFLSMAASAWSTSALLLAIPRAEGRDLDDGSQGTTEKAR